MDHLRSFFAANRDQVAANIAANRVPSPEQLDAFIRNLCTHVAQILGGGAPARVKQICANNFAEIGWDTKRNRSVDARRRTPDQLLEFLQRTLAELENWSPVVHPTDEELADLGAACNKLWELDVNRLAPGEDYRINLQRGKTPYQPGDSAPDPLFEFVSPAAFRKPTYAAFIALLDNYERTTGVAEAVTAEEKRENRSFLELCMDTAVMQYVHQYLVRKGKMPASPDQFLQRLNDLWFTLYRRETEGDSSGFEHVFLGESKAGDVSGMHNWIQLYMEERAGRLDYKGYIKPKVKARGPTVPSEYEQLITIQFSWYDELKPVSSSFIGVSPEFEVALYSLFFFMNEEKQVVSLGPYRAEITVHRYRSRGHDYIGTAYPGPAPLTEDQAATKIQSTFRRKQATPRR